MSSFIVFEICQGARSELAIFVNYEKAQQVVSLLYQHWFTKTVVTDYEITDLYGALLYSTKATRLEAAAYNLKY